MKKIMSSAAVIALIVLGACGNNGETDSKKIADSTNTANIDSAKKTDTVANSNNHLADLKPDAEFVVAAADGGMLEVNLGKMAEKKGATKQIKALGAMMVKDHSKANDELKALALEKNITIPTTMSEKCQKKAADLSEKSGKDFDKAYADLMVNDHKDDIDDFKKEADKGHDSNISLWAKGKVPVLEHHLMMSEKAKDTLK